MIEKLIFNLLAFTLFILIFIQFVRKNDTSYVYLLVAQFVGIAINFIELWCGKNFSIILKFVMYLLSVILPALVLYLEISKKVCFGEIFNLLLAKIYLLIGKQGTAKRYLIQLTTKYPDSYKGHLMLAKIYEEQEEYDMSLSEYEMVFEYDKTDKQIYITIGKLYGKVGKDKEAIEILTEVLKKEPDYYDASIILGDILYNKKDYKEAVQVYMSALRYKPMDYELYYNMGMAFTMINDFQKAKEAYEKAAQINTSLYNAKYNLGQISLLYGDLEESEQYFMKCIEEEAVEAGSYYYLARIAIIKGETEKAVNYLNVAIEENNEIYKKIFEENIFAPIVEKVNKPNKEQPKKNKKSKKLSPKEIEINEHLSHTYNLVGKLNNDDIEMMENVKKTREKENEKNLKEREV